MRLDSASKQYLTITLSYWAFTLTDGALRMLVLFFFYGLGYTPIELASLFILYEFFGILTNLYGGWLATRIGLNTALHIGLALQILALGMLTIEPSKLSLVYVMLAQAVSGIAKDLNKMSAKSSIKLLVSDNHQAKLYRWVTLLTGSKNSLKGLGFFLGGFLMATLGFANSLLALMALLALTLLLSLIFLQSQKTTYRPKFSEILSKSRDINLLSAARFFLFGSRDIWFVVALPVYLQSQLQWSHLQVGSFLACWVIGYGFIQALAPNITRNNQQQTPRGSSLTFWVIRLAVIPALIAGGLIYDLNPAAVLIIGLLAYGAIFAINSSIHSFLIVAFSQRDSVSTDVGFYYMANAAGRLTGTLLSGFVYQQHGLTTCLILSSMMVIISAILSAKISR
ncbi:MAG: organoarsenical effux MFS transporter ArsJ [Porticoccaceae bacterium]|nr:organoarsenical effux MFS transporter ArsJ [Porticoccaceae bacterium]